MDFDPNAGSDTTASIMDYASDSIGWLEDQRSSATTAGENTSAALSRSSEVYSNQTGVNLDEEADADDGHRAILQGGNEDIERRERDASIGTGYCELSH